MEIIEHGHKPLGKIKYFECENCGCIFKAHEKEYSEAKSFKQSEESATAECTCPDCGHVAFSYE